MQNIVIDTSVYLSSLIKQETDHLSSVDFFDVLKKQNNKKIIIPQIVLYEVVRKVSQLIPQIDLLQLYQSFAGNNDTASLFYFDQDFDRFYLSNLGKFNLKTSDSLVALSALYNQAILISWDKKLLDSSKKNLKVYTPTQYVRISKN